MKYDVAMKWVEALRSGKYQQARGVLKSSDSKNRYCCLGVLCEISELDEFIYDLDRGNLFNGRGVLPPSNVVEWAGLKCTNPYIVLNNTGHQLADINDQGVSFTEIADLIEKNWETL